MGHIRSIVDAMFVQETVTNDLIYLQRMLNVSDDDKYEEAAHAGSGWLPQWLDSTSSDVEITPEMQEALDADEPWEAVEKMTPEDRQEFGEWVMPQMERNAEGPPWLFMEFRKLLRNEWLIHFSDNANYICSEGFTKGVAVGDEHMLGISTGWSERVKSGGYNFAYRVGDFEKYGRADRGGGWKYGSEAVVFQASGALVYHFGDQEPQVIFLGSTARNIVYVHEDNGEWIVGDSDHPAFRHEKLDDVVDWVLANFDQYRRAIACR